MMKIFDHFYGLGLGILFLRHSDNLIVSLQTKDLCAAETQTIAKHIIATLKKIRTDENCHLFWEYVKQKVSKLDLDAPKLSKKTKAPTKTENIFGGKTAPEHANDVIFHYCRIYFESLDCLINALEDRFDQEDFTTYVKLKNLLLEVAKGDVFIQECNDIMTIYFSDFDENRLQVQFETLQENFTNPDGNACIRSVTDTFRKVTLAGAAVWRCSVKKVFLEISQNSQKNTCTGVSFLIRLQASLHPENIRKPYRVFL